MPVHVRICVRSSSANLKRSPVLGCDAQVLIERILFKEELGRVS
jgi:hypothetical protein